MSDLRDKPTLMVPKTNYKNKRRGGKRARQRKQMLLERDGNCCHYCKKKMTKPGHDGYVKPTDYTIEHVVPLCMGTGNNMYNIMLACSECNHKFDKVYVKCYCAFCANARDIYERGQR